VCVCVCVCVCACVCVYVCANAHIRLRMHVRVHVCTTFVCVHACGGWIALTHDWRQLSDLAEMHETQMHAAKA